MDDIEINLREESARAHKAKQILEDPMVKDSFERLEKELIEGLIATPADATEKREKLHMMLVFGRKWRNTFASLIQTGHLADLQLEQKRKFKLWSNNG